MANTKKEEIIPQAVSAFIGAIIGLIFTAVAAAAGSVPFAILGVAIILFATVNAILSLRI